MYEFIIRVPITKLPPNTANAKIEQMTQENSIDFQNMANVQLKDFKVREL